MQIHCKTIEKQSGDILPVALPVSGRSWASRETESAAVRRSSSFSQPSGEMLHHNNRTCALSSRRTASTRGRQSLQVAGRQETGDRLPKSMPVLYIIYLSRYKKSLRLKIVFFKMRSGQEGSRNGNKHNGSINIF